MRPRRHANGAANRLISRSTDAPVPGADPADARINGNRATVSNFHRCPFANPRANTCPYATLNPRAGRNVPFTGCDFSPAC